MRRLLGALAMFAGALGLPATARAQTARLVPIAIYPETPVRLELQLPDSRQPVALCQGACTAYLPPGKYRIEVHAGSETRAGGRVVNVPGPSALFVKPRSEGMRTSGLTLGIAGSALLVGGMVLLATALDDDYDDDGYRRRGTLVPLGLGAVVVGLVLTPIGWVRFGKSLRPAVDVEPLGAVR
ncbi:MAG: hypothetical protein M3020_16265 [Myxococcota bacterium]|nr:hypothetical protein [Myxococcota bacterium]